MFFNIFRQVKFALRNRFKISLTRYIQPDIRRTAKLLRT
jgi:hypothetical protein